MSEEIHSVVDLTLNGAAVRADVRPGERLSDTLRSTLDALDVKVGCNAGDCGACTVLLDGAPVCACLTPTAQAEGRKVVTLRGVDPAILQRLQSSFASHQAAQCGICTPGMIVSAAALLSGTAAPSIDQVQDALGGVLCRCTGYRKIIDAVVAAGQNMEAGQNALGAVGDSIARLDAAERTDGTAVFGDDAAPKDALSVYIVRSPFAHAAFDIGDLDGFATALGLNAVLTEADVPGLNAHGVIPGFIDQPVFAVNETRFKGEAVAAFVGPADVIAQISERDVPVTWTELPAVMDVDAAQKADAPQLHTARAGNIMCGGFVARGDIDAGLAAATVRRTLDVTTAYVEHAYIEPEAGYAEIVDGRLEMHVCTQAPVMNQVALADILDMPLDMVRIVPTAVGGGFGSKLDLSIHPYIALAALKTGQPVRMVLSRSDSMATSTKRHPGVIRIEAGVDADGHVTGLRFDGDFNTGAYASWGPTVANRVPLHASGPYRIAHYRAESKAVHTHGPSSGAFRGFGVPQSAIAQEGVFDELAEAIGMDALDFRILNALDNGVPTISGQVFTQGVGIKPCLEALRPEWIRAQRDCASFNTKHDTVKRGVGLAGGWYGCGNTSMPNPSTIKCGLRADGTLVLHQGAVDIGQGSNTVIAQIFAQSLGVPLDQVTLVGGDTDITPDAGKTSASRQTFVSGNAAKLSGASLRAQILALVNAPEDAELIIKAGTIQISGGHEMDLSRLEPDRDGYVFSACESYDPPTEPLDANGQGEPYAQFGYAAHLAELEVDTKLGTVRLLNIVAAHDVGKAINPLLVEGQVQGGVAQGLGMALMEEFIPGRTENLHDYLIPTIGDVPPIKTVIVEEPDAHGPYGAKGLGEHALIPTAPAILNAIKNATGVRMTQVPVVPHRLRAALKEAGYE